MQYIMNHKIRFNLLGLLAAAAATLLTAACVRDPLNEVSDGDTAIVRFTVQPEKLPAATRAGDDPEGNVDYSGCHISDGTKAKLLVYAVYDEDGSLLPEFGRGVSEELSGIEPGDGQTYVKVEKFPYTIELRLKRNKTYKVAFWAQDPASKFYDIQDLKAVKVHYTEVEAGDASSTPNNDESRDAFCRVETFTLNKKSDENRTVLLYRPLAQINVGTTGYDYETAVQMKKYAYSRIQIASAARYLDVVNDQIRIDNDKDSKSVLEFGYAKIPAYINCDVPDDLTVLQEKEEFLKVHLYDKEEDEPDYYGYAGLDKDGKETETFKYLSMCYVLVPSDTQRDEKGNTLYKYKSTTIDRLRVWLATDDQGSDEKEIIDISNVHATRNWRTNIVGDILTANVNLSVVLDPIYAGDVNGFYEDGDVAWSGWLDEYHGAYYDAAEDEILISNAGGLLWLQQMVNGDLLYTVDAGQAKAGEPIRYYDENHDEHAFGDKSEQPYFKGIPDPTTRVKDKSAYENVAEYEKAVKEAQQLKARILRATHQDKNPGLSEKYPWPERNNFHFVGEDENDRAKVKLVADIDLSGIEWLGIGFDCKMDQTLDMLCDNGSKEQDKKIENGPYDKKKHRGFFGHFDGNGHTISNLTTKRFSMDVHPYSQQLNSGGPYEAVQWYARGFFGQLGGAAIVENLTLRNVDIHGYHCVGGIAGAAIGVHPAQKRGKKINIINCVVDGGTIENVPMYRGDSQKSGVANNRTWARGVNTGGIVGLYNASGSVDGNRVSNLTIDGYRMVGGIVGSLSSYYLAYTDNTFSGKNTGNDKSIFPSSISNNVISNTVILADHFKPFATFRHMPYNDDYTDPNTKVKTTYTTDWAYGFSWGFSYNTFVDRLVGGDTAIPESTSKEGNTVDGADVQVVDLAGTYMLEGKAIKGRTTDIDNVPIELLPVLDNWFVDDAKVVSNLIGEAKSYKRYTTSPFAFESTQSNVYDSPFPMFKTYDREWVEASGRVGMYVGAITLDGTNSQNQGNSVLSVRGVTGTNDCAMLVSACDRTQFTGNPDKGWYTAATTTVSHLSVRGNPYAYTGICLAPNPVMSAITISDVSVYDVYQTLALAELEEMNTAVWPKRVVATNVTLTVEDSNLRGYTVPGAGWKSIRYENIIFEKGARVLSEDNPDLATEYTCKVEKTAGGTAFVGCQFKAPFIIEIAEGASVSFDETCKAVFGLDEAPIAPDPGCKRIRIETSGVSYEYE